MASVSNRTLQGRIHGACASLGLDEDTRRDMQVRVTGKSSTKDMTGRELQLVIDELKTRGWKPKPKARKRNFRPAAQRPDQRFVFVLWRLLAEAGVVKVGDTAMRTFITNKNFAAKWGEAMTDPNMMSPERCRDVIEALKAVARRHGVPVKRP